MLGPRALNRALLERVRRPVAEVVEHLVGLQAQAPDAPYYGLWSRIDGFVPADLAGLLTGRAVVRATMLRGTLHAVTARDCLDPRMLAAATQERAVRTNTDFDGERVAGVPVGAVCDAAAELLDRAPRTPAELRAALARRWPAHDAHQLGYAARALVPTVQVPPRGLWTDGGPPRVTTTRSWLGRPVRADPEPGALLPR